MLLPHLAGAITETAELEDGRLRIWARSGTEGAACRRCGQFSSRMHSRYRRRLADAPVGGHPVVLWLGVRRFFCGNAGCKAVTFAEQLQGLTSPRSRRTPPLARMLTAITLAMAGRAGTRLAAELDLPARRTGMLRLVMSLPDPETGTVTIAGIDDFAFRRGRDYGTILIDVETGRPVDLLRDREADTVADWLKEHPDIKVICRDRADSYADAGRQGAPQADHVADRWHLYHYLCEHVGKATARHRACLEEPASGEPVQASVPDAPEVPDLQQAAIEAAARRAEESVLAIRTRQRYELVQSRLETGIPVQRHSDFHRPGIGNHRLGAAPVTGIPAVAAFRVVLSVTQVVIQLAFQRALDDHFRQLAEQAVVAGQLQPAGAGPLGELAQQLLIGG
jgi:hypothetical protein